MIRALRVFLWIALSLGAQQAFAAVRSDCDPSELVGLAPIPTPVDLERDKSWTVTMAADVAEDGSLSKPRIVKSSVSRAIDLAVMAALAKVRKVTGTCLARRGTLFLQFRLRGDSDVPQNALTRAWREFDESAQVISNHE
jgi:hypothetical protein